MPNHVTNILRVSGDPEKVRAMFEAIKNDEIGLGSFDFNKVIPMPEHIFRGNLGTVTASGFKKYHSSLRRRHKPCSSKGLFFYCQNAKGERNYA